MRFVSPRDFSAIIGFNKEIINDVVDAIVVLLKPSVTESDTNVYGESQAKEYFDGIQIPCLIAQQPATIIDDMGTINVRQTTTFAFLRQELIDRNIYPENGDIVWWDNQYFQIDNVNETRKWAGQQGYNHSIICDAHITQMRDLQLEEPNV